MQNLNNASMKTVVETFIIEETQELIYDNEQLDKWNDMVSALGLKGQSKICAPEKSPIPFLPMKRPITRVFETLCPVKVSVLDYDKSPIPVEILSLVSLAVKEGYFNKIEIWYDDKNPDPACVGSVGRWVAYNNKWATVGSFVTEQEAIAAKAADDGIYNVAFAETQKYLIGKWGDVKMGFKELTAKAKSVFMAEKKNRLLTSIKDAQRELEDLELDSEREFGFEASLSDDLPF